MTGIDRTGPWEGQHFPLMRSTEIVGESLDEELVTCAHSGFTVPISQTVIQGGRRIWVKFAKEPHPRTGFGRP